MDEETLNTSQTPTSPLQELPDLSPPLAQDSFKARNFPVSDPNLKPLEIGNSTLHPRPINPSSQFSTPTNPVPELNIPNPSIGPASVQAVPNIPVIATPNEPEIFVNLNPPASHTGQFIEENIVTPSNPLRINQGTIIPPPPEKNFGKLPNFRISKTLVFVIISMIILLGGGGFAVNEFVINKITTLKLVSDSAEFYLSLAVKQNPQAQKAKDLIKKLPGSDQILKQFDKSYTDFIGNPNDPLVDAIHYANSEIFLTRISRSTGNTDYSQHLLAIVDVKDNQTAKTDVGNFADDINTYKTTTSDYNGTSISNVQLKSEVTFYDQNLSQSLSLNNSLSTPKPKTTYMAALDHYLVAGQNQDDLKKTADLSKTKTFFGFGGSDKTKTILNDADHQEIATNFPDSTFIKYFARQPLTTSNTNFLSLSAFGITTTPQTADTESRTYQKIAVGLDAEIANDGATVHSYSLDWYQPTANLADTFKINNSLATQLPKTFSGISPTLYTETRDLKGQWQTEKDMANKLANSDNRNQRQDFQNYLDSLDQQKKEFKDAYGIDYENDLLSWMDGQVAFIFNAGSSKKAPEALLIAQIKDKQAIESSLNKIKIPNFTAQTEDAQRKVDLTYLSNGLRAYYYDNSSYPSSLNSLVSNTYTYGIHTLPKDPVTGNDYAYLSSSDKKSYTLSATLYDNTTLTITNTNTTGTITGTKKDINVSSEKTIYNGVNIYKTKIYNYHSINYFLIHAVTDKKAIIAFTDSDQSIKDIIDFEKRGGQSLNKNNAWQKQFSNVTQPVGLVSFIEPINLWGLVDYLAANYPDYKNNLANYTSGGASFDDMETVGKAYLKTFSSIGTITEKKKPVYVTTTFVNIVELGSKEKQAAEEAINRLDNSSSSVNSSSGATYKPILGISTQNFDNKAKTDLTNLYNLKIKPFIFPKSFLTQ